MFPIIYLHTPFAMLLQYKYFCISVFVSLHFCICIFAFVFCIANILVFCAHHVTYYLHSHSICNAFSCWYNKKLANFWFLDMHCNIGCIAFREPFVSFVGLLCIVWRRIICIIYWRLGETWLVNPRSTQTFHHHQHYSPHHHHCSPHHHHHLHLLNHYQLVCCNIICIIY